MNIKGIRDLSTQNLGIQISSFTSPDMQFAEPFLTYITRVKIRCGLRVKLPVYVSQRYVYRHVVYVIQACTDTVSSFHAA